MPKIQLMMAAALLALAAGGAAAQRSSTMSLPPWRYVLTDLAPLDGIAPSITLTPTSFYSFIGHGPGWQPQIDNSGAPLYWEEGGNRASAWSLPTGLELAVRGVDVLVSTSAYREYAVTLSPFTQVSFFQPAHTELVGTLATAYARAQLSVALSVGRETVGDWDERMGVDQGRFDYTLSASVASVEQVATGRVSLYTNAYAALAPIPEPEQYAMLLAGLSLLGLRRLRMAKPALAA